MRGVDAVVHMAALLHIVNPPPELREKYERVNIGGTATVVEAAIKAGVKRVVLFMDIAVDGSLIQKELGFMPQYDLRTGWEETIREMRA